MFHHKLAPSIELAVYALQNNNHQKGGIGILILHRPWATESSVPVSLGLNTGYATGRRRPDRALPIISDPVDHGMMCDYKLRCLCCVHLTLSPAPLTLFRSNHDAYRGKHVPFTPWLYPVLPSFWSWLSDYAPWSRLVTRDVLALCVSLSWFWQWGQPRHNFQRAFQEVVSTGLLL